MDLTSPQKHRLQLPKICKLKAKPNVLLKNGLICEVLCSVLESRHLERHTISDTIVDPGSGTELTSIVLLVLMYEWRWPPHVCVHLVFPDSALEWSLSLVLCCLLCLCFQVLFQKLESDWEHSKSPLSCMLKYFQGFFKAGCSFWLLPHELSPGLALSLSLSVAYWSLVHQALLYTLPFGIFFLHSASKGCLFPCFLYLPAGSCLWPWRSSCDHPAPLFYFVKKPALELGYESLLQTQACLFKNFFYNLCLGSENQSIETKRKQNNPYQKDTICFKTAKT